MLLQWGGLTSGCGREGGWRCSVAPACMWGSPVSRHRSQNSLPRAAGSRVPGAGAGGPAPDAPLTDGPITLGSLSRRGNFFLPGAVLVSAFLLPSQGTVSARMADHYGFSLARQGERAQGRFPLGHLTTSMPFTPPLWVLPRSRGQPVRFVRSFPPLAPLPPAPPPSRVGYG